MDGQKLMNLHVIECHGSPSPYIFIRRFMLLIVHRAFAVCITACTIACPLSHCLRAIIHTRNFWQLRNQARVFQSSNTLSWHQATFSLLSDKWHHFVYYYPWSGGIFMGTEVEDGVTELPQMVAKLITAIATKNWKQPQLRIQHIIRSCGATAGYNNSYIGMWPGNSGANT